MECSPKIRYLKPKNKVRSILFDLVLNYKFEYGIMTVIAINVFFMSLYHYDMDSELNDSLEISNYIFVVIYIIEFLLKIIGLGGRYYFASSWNKFDFVILVFGILSLSEGLLPFNATVLRVLRIARLFRVIKVLKGLRSLF